VTLSLLRGSKLLIILPRFTFIIHQGVGISIIRDDFDDVASVIEPLSINSEHVSLEDDLCVRCNILRNLVLSSPHVLLRHSYPHVQYYQNQDQQY
jgi:hypothetical protein